MFRNNVFITCCKLSKSLFNPEKVQGSTMQTPIKIRWLPITSIDAPQILAQYIHFWHNFPETLRVAPSTRPSFRRRQSGCGWGEVLWWFCWCLRHRPRPGRDGKQSVKRMTRGWLVAKQQIPNLKQLLMLGYLTGKLNQYFMCQQTACTLTLKETPHVSCIRSPPGLEVIIANFATCQIRPCHCLVHAKGTSQGLKKNWSVNRLPDPFSWTQRRVWGNPVFANN